MSEPEPPPRPFISQERRSEILSKLAATAASISPAITPEEIAALAGEISAQYAPIQQQPVKNGGGKENKDDADSKHTKDTKDTKESKDATAKDSKDNKEHKETKDASTKDSKDAKEYKEGKDAKETKEANKDNTVDGITDWSTGLAAIPPTAEDSDEGGAQEEIPESIVTDDTSGTGQGGGADRGRGLSSKPTGLIRQPPIV